MMIDREKLVKALECLKEGSYCECCDYKPHDDCIKRVATDAIAMLKEQKAVEPETESAVYDVGTWWYICGACKMPIDKTDVFCRHCGRSVKWE